MADTFTALFTYGPWSFGVMDPDTGSPYLTIREGGGAYPITTPLLSDHPTSPNLPGDFRPVFRLQGVDPYPLGAVWGDTVQCQYGTSTAAAEALTPVEATLDESWEIDVIEPFPDMGDYGETLTAGQDLLYRMRIKRGTDFSNWTPFKTLSIVDGVMDAPGWTDLTNQTGGTRVWSSGKTVTGMATGAYARLTGTGPLKVGTTVYEAGEVALVQNGDTLYAGVDTSSTGGATVDNVVKNRGTTLETFSATTIGAAADATAGAAPDALNINYTGRNADFSVSLSAGDQLIWVVGGYNYSVIDVLIDGVSIAAGYIDASQSGSNFIAAYRTTVASAGTKTVRVTIAASNLQKVGIAVTNLSNCATGAPTVVKLALGGGVNTPKSVGTMTIPTDGIGVLCSACLANNGAASWTSATELTDNNTGNFTVSTAKMTTTANPQINGTGWAYQNCGAMGIIFAKA